ncbi:PatB family C-S lyase [Acetomicrobium sp.]|uniref:MalY/PatB family protein n=1 Tax=Acetomicrobium sp. TaxID=1872099 RepID=UPI002FC9AA83
MAKYDFDEVIDRKGTCSEKWDGLKKHFGTDDVLPMWVADMDFKSPPEVIKLIVERSKHGIFGYPVRTESYYEAIINWVRERYDWEIKGDWIVDVPSVMPGIAAAILAFTSQGGSVMIQPPVYPPFFEVIESLDRQVLPNRLQLGEKWHMDFSELERQLPSAKAFLLCNPHNPVGRVWTAEDLLSLSRACLKAGVPILSDDIHCDFVYPGHKYTPLASLDEESLMNTVTFMSASKTFNIAGFKNAYAIVPNAEMREKLSKILKGLHFGSGGLFGILGLEVAYRYEKDWLGELILYLEENRDIAVSALQKARVDVISPEGTYLLWLDLRKLGLSQDELMKFLIEKAKLGLNDGLNFGPDGAGFVRMNIGCPRKILREGINRLVRALS